MNSAAKKQALLFGGTGEVGKAVLRLLADAGVATAFTYFKSDELARQLQNQYAFPAYQVDFNEPRQTRQLMRQLADDGITPDIFIHCAAVTQNKALAEVSDDDWDSVQKINCQSAFIACQELAKPMAAKRNGDIVLLGALDRSQSIKLPVHFAASQGMLAAMTMALAKSLGGSGIRVNLITLGLLTQGLSTQLDPKLRAHFSAHCALGRCAGAEEIARAVEWLALHNTYISGKVIPVNGGI